MKSIVCRYDIWVWTLGYCEGRGGVIITGGLEMVEAGEVFLVDRTFCRSCRRGPLVVAKLLGKCFRTSAELRPGHVVKKQVVIVLI